MAVGGAEAGFEALLGARRAEVEASLAAIAADLDDLADARGQATADDEHDPEGVTLSGEWSRLAGLRSSEERELAEIDAAVVRVAAGTYGVCTSCGRPIPAARLRARPMATLCVRCAERQGR